MSEPQPATPALPYAFDPEVAEMAALVAGRTPPTDAVKAREESNAMFSMMPAPDESGVAIENREIPGPAGDPPVPVRIYAPEQRSGAATPGILYIHGGGFFVGSIDTEHAAGINLARELGVVVASVEYRLAPEHPYPAGLEDCYAALQWFHGAADELDLDTGRIAICGSSAGGGLSAALALLARDRGGPAVCFQYLGIPELDDRLDTPSMQAFVDTPMWSRPAAVKSWEWYLGDLWGTDDVPYTAAPARAEDLTGLPPAYVSVMEFDPLRDEGLDYAVRMIRAGVPVELHHFPGTFHGSAMAVDAAVNRRAAAETLAVWRKVFGI